MAFVQQQRRRTTATRQTSSEVLYSDQLIPATTPSDSETDWHVISSASNNSSPILFPSESEETESYRDTEESDFQTSGGEEDETTFLPSHDGTGTFIVEDSEFFSSDQATTTSEEDEEGEDTEFKSAIENLTLDNSILDMILQKGTPPSFASPLINQEFKPTIAGLNSQELLIGVISSDEDDKVMMNNLISDGGGGNSHIKFTSKLQKDLDRIPIHHPRLPGSSTSTAILSLVWDSIKRITNHLLENDTNTIETISTIMSEAVLEGCLPFSSHLHMEIENHHYHHQSLLEVE